ncbi:class I SAM-dependent DNA methyltransferase [Corallococcus sp. M7]
MIGWLKPLRDSDPSSSSHLVSSVATSASQLINRLWSYCNILRDDGLSYGDYVEQLTFLLFLKMAHERTGTPWNQKSPIPPGYDWSSLLKQDLQGLQTHYERVLSYLGKQSGMLGIIFRKAQNKIQDPAKLRRLIVDLIDREQWTTLDVDVKGDTYEGLLEKNAQDTKSGAGQYFTPRPLIQAIVEVIRPTPSETICDPACGTGGFLLAAHSYISKEYPDLSKAQKKHLALHALRGVELVESVARLCAMNLLLHGVGPVDEKSELPIRIGDSLRMDVGSRYDIVLSNPPFGKRSSVVVVNENGEESREALSIMRDDFLATTSNKQLNFMQHIRTLLAGTGRAAVVIPDNVLFEGGAGELIRRELLMECDVHTLLRLPTGIFYAQGVKANVLFFDRLPSSKAPGTKKLWIYDLRTNQRFTLRTNPLKRSDLDDFVQCYKPGGRHRRKATWSESMPNGRWRSFDYDTLIRRDNCNLDIFWLKGESLGTSGDQPELLAADIVEDLRSALEHFAAVEADLRSTGGSQDKVA